MALRSRPRPRSRFRLRQALPGLAGLAGLHPTVPGRQLTLAGLLLVASLAACGGSGGSSGGGSGGAAPAPAPPPAVPPPWASASLAGGDTTNLTGNQSSTGFDTPAPNLDAADLDLHREGDGEFSRNFIRGPSADFPDGDGLGPAFNNVSCLACHIRDGRASYSLAALQAPAGQWTQLGSEAGIFLRLALAAVEPACTPTTANRYCAPTGVPGFGSQLFHRGVLGLRTDSPFTGQADVFVRFEASTVSYLDGSTVTLSRPVFEIRNPWDAPGEAPPAAGITTPPRSRLLQADVRTSPRNAMPMFGLGLLEAIPEADILALADPDDRNGDGISGRPNFVPDPLKVLAGNPDPLSLGRFGWKAASPSVQAQSANAYRDDMGLTNALFRDESIAGTGLYDNYRALYPDDDGQDGREISDAVLASVSFYANTLAVPARRQVDDATVLRGAGLFESLNCSGCHHPSFRTGPHPGVWTPGATLAVVAVAGQQIYPYTDLLLHDMGEDLADNRPEFQANGREWRTRPLWGLGLTRTVNALAGFLHDGRARTVEEAILWHGGEALASREAFRGLNAEARSALLAFLQSL